MMRTLLLLIACCALAACNTIPENRVPEKLELNGLDKECPKQLPELTEDINSSELSFLEWIGRVNLQYQACADSKSSVIRVLRDNQVIR